MLCDLMLCSFNPTTFNKFLRRYTHYGATSHENGASTTPRASGSREAVLPGHDEQGRRRKGKARATQTEGVVELKRRRTRGTIRMESNRLPSVHNRTRPPGGNAVAVAPPLSSAPRRRRRGLLGLALTTTVRPVVSW